MMEFDKYLENHYYSCIMHVRRRCALFHHRIHEADITYQWTRMLLAFKMEQYMVVSQSPKI